MDFRKKDVQNKNNELKTDAEKAGKLPDSAPFNEEQFTSLYQKAQDQIKIIEQKIANERELWYQRIKQKEEDQVSLKSQLDMLVYKVEQERKKREGDLNILHQHIQKDLAELEKSISEEVKTWTEKINQKDKELEEIKHQSVFLETQKKLEAEKNIRDLQSSLESTKQKYKAIERQLIEEKNLWIDKVKSKEEEIINLKTQISLKEIQIKSEDEKAKAKKRDLQLTWQGQTKEMEEKLEKLRKEWTDTYKNKEEELFTLKIALEEHLTAIALEAEKQEKEISSMNNRISDRIVVIEKSIEEEKSRWQELLKAREEEFKGLKAELVLKESQEKAEREQRFKELKEEESQAGRKLKDIGQRIEQEKENWKVKIFQKDEELKILKIQSEIKLKELQDEWLDKESKTKEEKEALIERLKELENKLNTERAAWENELKGKDLEINQYTEQWALKKNNIINNERQNIEDLKNKKVVLENELLSLEESFNKEKLHWEELLKNKEKEVENYKNDVVSKESKIKRDLADFEYKFSLELEPFTLKTKNFEADISAASEEFQKQIALKETQKVMLQNSYFRQEEKLKKQLDAHSSRVSSQEGALRNKIAGVRSLIQAQSQNATEKLEKLKAQEAALKKQVETIEERIANERARISREYKTRREEMESNIKRLEIERRDVKKNMELKLSNKIKELENEEIRVKEFENKAKNEVLQKENELKLIIAKGDEELAGLRANLENAKKEYNQRIKEKEDEINKLFESVKTNETRINGEKNKLEQDLNHETQALLLKRKELEGALLKEKKAYEKEVAAIDSKIASLRQSQELKTKDYEAMQVLWHEKIAQTKSEYNKKIDEMHLNRDDANNISREMIDRLEKEEIELQQNLIESKSKYISETNNLKEKYVLKKTELNGLVEKLNLELEELRKTVNKDLSLKNNKLEEEENKLGSIVSKTNKDLSLWEKELNQINETKDKEISVLKANIEKSKEEYTGKIRLQETRLLQVQEKIKNDEKTFEAERKGLDEKLSAEIEPLLEKYKYLKNQLTVEQQSAEIDLAALEKKITGLKKKQDELEADYAVMHAAWNEKVDKAKQDYEKEISNLKLEQARIEAEHKDMLESQENDFKAIEKYSLEQLEQFKKQKEDEINRSRNQVSKLQDDMRGLELEISSIQNSHPQILKTKSDEISNLEKQISDRSVFYAREQEKAEKDIENYQKRSEERILKLREGIESLKAKFKIEQDDLNKKYMELRQELEKKNKDKKEELISEEKIYFEQKVNLEKQKNELLESLKNTKTISQEQLRQKEKEILALQSELSQKEKAWEQSWQIKEKEFSAEKAGISDEIENLAKRSKEEEEIYGKRLQEKEAEIEQLRTQYDIRLKKLEDEISHKKVAWEQTNTGLSSQVMGLTEQLASMQKNYEEAITLKEKDLSVLKSNLEFWELRSKTNEEKRLAAWEDEKLSLENRIKESSLKLSSFEKEYNALIEEKSKIATRINEEARITEQDKLNQWKQFEAGLTAQHDHLLKEVEAWQERIKKETIVSDDKIKALEREVDKMKLEASLKDTMIQSDQQKMEREHRKVQQKLKEELMALEHRMAEEKEDWLSKLRLKEEEIETLKVRLTMREERRQNEINKREEEVKRIIKELEYSLTAIQDDYNKKIPEKKDRIDTLQEQLNSILKEIETKEKQWKEKQENRNRALNEGYAGLMKDIGKLESELEQESKKMNELIMAKEKQIENLAVQMTAKENDLVVERSFTQEIITELKFKSEEFKRVFKKHTSSQSINKADEIGKLFEACIEYFNSEKYAEAKDNLENIIKAEPDFSGAYKYLALCYWNLGQKEEALNTAQKALLLEPENEELTNWIKSIKNRN
ncbi:MAG: tetratricopeptide repeat protein [Elusimicrobia bacterium]|nr:tetratricopeptide repeat protein [Candidatus Liberimonas magnetica]